MFDLSSGQFNFNAGTCIDLILSLIVLVMMFYAFSKVFKSKAGIASEIVLFILIIVSWLFGLTFIWTISICVLTAVTTIIFLQDANTVKNPFASKSQKKKLIIERIYDREEVCNKIASAVQTLSKTKTGALITFERHDKFDDVVKSGTEINSPISPELIQTIFYPGTRLHDGAVVIRQDRILAASVYYTPTTKPLNGKYGSRHRAAIGISEKTDSITVVVSEETGRISIAYKGELTSVLPDNFTDTLLDYLKNED